VRTVSASRLAPSVLGTSTALQGSTAMTQGHACRTRASVTPMWTAPMASAACQTAPARRSRLNVRSMQTAPTAASARSVVVACLLGAAVTRTVARTKPVTSSRGPASHASRVHRTQTAPRVSLVSAMSAVCCSVANRTWTAPQAHNAVTGCACSTPSASTTRTARAVSAVTSVTASRRHV